MRYFLDFFYEDLDLAPRTRYQPKDLRADTTSTVKVQPVGTKDSTAQRAVLRNRRFRQNPQKPNQT
jgi:hypothetical protein